MKGATNDLEAAPNQVEMKILDETGAQNMQPIEPKKLEQIPTTQPTFADTMKKNILFLIVLPIMVFMTQSVLSQDNNKLKIIDYLIKIGDLNPIDKKETYLDNVFIVDILTFAEASKKETGIFKFGTFADHSKVYILLRDKESFQILSLDKLDEDLLLELTFL
ncbi:MAG: hypothetical protein WC780_15665 [Lentimicrobiaceae bacterium]|jgi:hypothetical protein